ncbi:MAG: ATP-dependent RecD-like DNA helicase, partial [Eubacteriales bacterium]|nr:ATP-dependent RecD-like DNA helicase [Eubacteriales bacterium]
VDEDSLIVCYDDNRLVEYDYKQIEDLDLAYCLSVHKSQGSEFPVVVMPVIGGPPILITRNLFYTAMTRARKMVVLAGFPKAVEDMVQNTYIDNRFTSLKEQLFQTQVQYGDI